MKIKFKLTLILFFFFIQDVYGFQVLKISDYERIQFDQLQKILINEDVTNEKHKIKSVKKVALNSNILELSVFQTTSNSFKHKLLREYSDINFSSPFLIKCNAIQNDYSSIGFGYSSLFNGIKLTHKIEKETKTDIFRFHEYSMFYDLKLFSRFKYTISIGQIENTSNFYMMKLPNGYEHLLKIKSGFSIKSGIKYYISRRFSLDFMYIKYKFPCEEAIQKSEFLYDYSKGIIEIKSTNIGLTLQF